MNILQLHLHTQKLILLQDFYTQQLGFELITQSEDSFSFRVGKSVLKFSNSASDTSPFYHFAFNISPYKIQEAYNWLIKRGVSLIAHNEQTIIPFPNWNAEALYFFDTGGNVVELIARKDIPHWDDSAFSIAHFLSISEIGFPVPTIAEFYQAIEQNFSLLLYSPISNLTTFCAAGNPEGLFIIVPLQRVWFPTSIVNDIFPIKVHILSGFTQSLSFGHLPYSITSE